MGNVKSSIGRALIGDKAARDIVDDADVEDVGSEDGLTEPRKFMLLLLPNNKVYTYFWWIGVFLALVWAFIEPYKMVRNRSARLVNL